MINLPTKGIGSILAILYLNIIESMVNRFQNSMNIGLWLLGCLNWANMCHCEGGNRESLIALATLQSRNDKSKIGGAVLTAYIDVQKVAPPLLY